MQATNETQTGTESKTLDWRDLNYNLKNGLLSRVRNKEHSKRDKTI